MISLEWSLETDLLRLISWEWFRETDLLKPILWDWSRETYLETDLVRLILLSLSVAAVPASAAVKTVFTSSGAAGILTNDLVRIMENEKVGQVLANLL